MDETSLLKCKIEMEMYITQREAMIAENKQREFAGQAMAYVEDSFEVVKHNLTCILNTIIKYG